MEFRRRPATHKDGLCVDVGLTARPSTWFRKLRRDVALNGVQIERGAAGVLNKAVQFDEVVGAVRRLRAGETLLPLAEVVVLIRYAGSQRQQEYEASKTIARLTGREIEVLQGLAEGLDSQGVADRLHITVRTERNHVASILSKLGVHSRLQAVVFAARHDLVEIT